MKKPVTPAKAGVQSLDWIPASAGMTTLMCSLVLGLAACRQTPPEASANVTVKQTPSQVLKDFEMNDVRSGAKTMTLQSIEARIYDEQHYADVDQPIVFFYKQGSLSSSLKAPVGRLQMETHEVETWGGVTVVTSDSSTLTTERLHYDPKKRKIFSKDPVRLEKPDSITDGIGLETDPELKSVKIGRQTVRFKKGMK